MGYDMKLVLVPVHSRENMLAYVFLALLASSAIAVPKQNFQTLVRRQNGLTRVVNGEDAKPGEYPYIVSLDFTGLGHTCGASPLTSRWAATAGHCCDGNTRPLEIHAGTNDLSKGGERYTVDSYIVHQDYSPEDDYKNDICVLHVTEDIQFNDYVKQVTLPKQGYEVPTGEDLQFAGWGLLRNGAPASEAPSKLQAFPGIQAITNEECMNKTHDTIYDSQLCTMGPNGTGACEGDSGSPLMNGDIQVGLASIIFSSCAGGYPDLFTRLSEFGDWIKNAIGDDSSELQFMD